MKVYLLISRNTQNPGFKKEVTTQVIYCYILQLFYGSNIIKELINSLQGEVDSQVTKHVTANQKR